MMKKLNIKSKIAQTMAIALVIALISPSIPAQAVEANLTEHDYVAGAPDRSVRFPQEAFELAGKLKAEKKYSDAEGILLDHLEQARKAARGTDQLGQFMVRLNNVLFDGGKDKQAIKYGEIASKILNKNSYRSKDSIAWQVNIESYLAMGYARLHKYKESIAKYKEAINLAQGAPPGKVAASWIQTLKEQKKVAEDGARSWK